MPFPALAAGLLFLFTALALLVMLVAVRKKRREMERRVKLVAAPVKPQAGAQVSQPDTGLSGKLGELLKTLLTFGAGYSWGMRAGPPQLALIALVSAAAAWLVTARGFDLPIWAVALATAAGLAIGPRTILLRQQDRANRDFTALFPDAVDMVTRMLRGGMPMTYAIQIVGNEAPPPVNTAFTMIGDQLKIGVPLAEALDSASRQIALPDFRFFAVAAIMQYSTGGNLIATLEDLSQIMRKRQAGRLKAKAVSAEIRFSAYVLGALPIVVVGALLVIEPDYLTPLIQDRRGHFILAMAGGGLLLAFLTMRQMIQSVGRE